MNTKCERCDRLENHNRFCICGNCFSFLCPKCIDMTNVALGYRCKWCSEKSKPKQKPDYDQFDDQAFLNGFF